MKKEKNESNAWGVSSLVTGILSLLLVFAPYFGLPLGIFAIVAGVKQNKKQELGIATAGKVMGIIGTVLNGIVLFIIMIIGIALLGVSY